VQPVNGRVDMAIWFHSSCSEPTGVPPVMHGFPMSVQVYFCPSSPCWRSVSFHFYVWVFTVDVYRRRPQASSMLSDPCSETLSLEGRIVLKRAELGRRRFWSCALQAAWSWPVTYFSYSFLLINGLWDIYVNLFWSIRHAEKCINPNSTTQYIFTKWYITHWGMEHSPNPRNPSCPLPGKERCPLPTPSQESPFPNLKFYFYLGWNVSLVFGSFWLISCLWASPMLLGMLAI
jgi:hypothetical protein